MVFQIEDLNLLFETENFVLSEILTLLFQTEN